MWCTSFTPLQRVVAPERGAAKEPFAGQNATKTLSTPRSSTMMLLSRHERSIDLRTVRVSIDDIARICDDIEASERIRATFDAELAFKFQTAALILTACVLASACSSLAEAVGSVLCVCAVLAGLHKATEPPVVGKVSQQLRAHLAASQASVMQGLSLQQQAAHEQAMLNMRVFAPDRTFDVAGMRLNGFAGLSNLNFERDVLQTVSAEQRRAYDEFSAQVDRACALRRAHQDPLLAFDVPDGFTKLRFLQGDGYHVDAAVTRLLNTMAWRQRIGLDEFISRPNAALLAQYRRLRPRRLLGYDKFDRPFIVERLGEFFSLRARGLSLEDWVLCYAYDVSELLASMREASAAFGGWRHHVSYMGDMRGLSARHAMAFLPVLKHLIKQVDVHFPEIAGQLLLIHVPMAHLWPMVRSFLDPCTAARITIDAGARIDQMDALFGRAVIPVEYGGELDVVIPHASSCA